MARLKVIRARARRGGRERLRGRRRRQHQWLRRRPLRRLNRPSATTARAARRVAGAATASFTPVQDGDDGQRQNGYEKRALGPGLWSKDSDAAAPRAGMALLALGAAVAVAA